MSNQTILTKAIQKAQANGFMTDHRFDYSKGTGWTYVLKEKPEQSDKGLTVNVTGMLSEADIIFDHQFAKALWPDPEMPLEAFMSGTKAHKEWQENGGDDWKYHLQQMVIADDPIKYLGENLPEITNSNGKGIDLA